MGALVAAPQVEPVGRRGTYQADIPRHATGRRSAFVLSIGGMTWMGLKPDTKSRQFLWFGVALLAGRHRLDHIVSSPKETAPAKGAEAV